MILTSACRHITGLMMSTATHFVLFIESLSDITNYITKLIGLLDQSFIESLKS